MPTFQFLAYAKGVQKPITNFKVTDLQEAVSKFFALGFDLPYNADVFTNATKIDMEEEFDVEGHRMNAAFRNNSLTGTFDTLVVNRQMVASGGKRKHKSRKASRKVRKSRRASRRH